MRCIMKKLLLNASVILLVLTGNAVPSFAQQTKNSGSPQFSQKQLERWQKRFPEADANGDGVLTAEEAIAYRNGVSGGSADSGFTAQVGAPTVCATGPVGANAHTPEEFMRLDTMVPRAKTVALAILRLDR